MTAAARITQADMERATKAVANAGISARIVMDLASQRIEIIIGESGAPAAAGDQVPPPNPLPNPLDTLLYGPDA
jgi:hypothetical protein